MSLSDNRIISLLNSRFVAVFTSNEDFRDGGSASPQEKAELNRIHQEGYAKKLSVGTVHAYVLDLDGHLIDSMHTATAANAEAEIERAATYLVEATVTAREYASV